MSWQVRQGEVREQLRELDTESVQTVVTSPPYWGLRDYGIDPSVWGGAPECEHEWGEQQRGKRTDILPADQTTSEGRIGTDDRQGAAALAGGRYCECGAWLGCLGLEPSPEQYVANLTDVFREIRRVLRPDGTVWLNLGDSYAAKARGSDNGWDKSRLTNPGSQQKAQAASMRGTGERHRGKSSGLKNKDLVGTPWRVAFALQADGWWLRSDIIWAKPNPMPESVTDRPTRSHEYLFLLAKSERYFYDSEAVREPYRYGRDHPRNVDNPPESHVPGAPIHSGLRRSGNAERKYGEDADRPGSHLGRSIPWQEEGRGRNRRSVWEIATRPYPEAHFATFPPALIEPCVLAGSATRASGGGIHLCLTRSVDRERSASSLCVTTATSWGSS